MEVVVLALGFAAGSLIRDLIIFGITKHQYKRIAKKQQEKFNEMFPERGTEQGSWEDALKDMESQFKEQGRGE